MRNRTEDQITLAFIRHGETPANAERRYLGKTDEALSEKGIETLKSYRLQKLYPDVEYLFSSPMKRCIDTAKMIYPMMCPIIIPEWEEMDFGRFEYRNYEELKDDAQYQEWINSGGTLDFPQGESRKDFTLRCKSGLIRMCAELGPAAERNISKPLAAGAIVHGGTIMSLLSLYEGTDYFDYQVSNGRGYVCRLTGINHMEGAQGDTIQIKVVKKI